MVLLFQNKVVIFQNGIMIFQNKITVFQNKKSKDLKWNLEVSKWKFDNFNALNLISLSFIYLIVLSSFDHPKKGVSKIDYGYCGLCE